MLCTAVLVLVACKNSPEKMKDEGMKDESVTANAENPSSNAEEAEVTLDGISQFIDWSNVMKVTKDGDGYVLTEVKNNEYVLRLKPEGGGVYQETSPEEQKLGQKARFVARKVGDVTTLAAYKGDMILMAMVSGDDLIAYRNRGYRRILTSNFEPTEDGQVTITDDTMKGPILPDSPDLTYFFVEDGEGDLTDKIRTSVSRFHLAYAPADKGVNLHTCNVIGETGDLEVNYGRENTIVLKYADDPGWKWLSTDVLDADFLIFNFDKPYWKVMLNKLKAVKEPNEVEKWNLLLIDNLVKYNDPFTALESTEE